MRKEEYGTGAFAKCEVAYSGASLNRRSSGRDSGRVYSYSWVIRTIILEGISGMSREWGPTEVPYVAWEVEKYLVLGYLRHFHNSAEL